MFWLPELFWEEINLFVNGAVSNLFKAKINFWAINKYLHHSQGGKKSATQISPLLNCRCKLVGRHDRSALENRRLWSCSQTLIFNSWNHARRVSGPATGDHSLHGPWGAQRRKLWKVLWHLVTWMLYHWGKSFYFYIQTLIKSQLKEGFKKKNFLASIFLFP